MSNNPFVMTRPVFPVINLVNQYDQFVKDCNTYTALQIAQRAGLQLVCFKTPINNELALCKIIDFNKWKYAQSKAQKEKAKEGVRKTKEIQFSPNIAEHDIAYKVKHANELLEEGTDIVFSMFLKGREIIHFNDAEIRFNAIVAMCENGKEVSRKKTNNSITVRVVKAKKEIT
jgi:translation initiation factor IF-3